MTKLTKTHKFRISEEQYNSFEILRKYDVKVDSFIRQAIKEKLQREWKCIKEKKEKIYNPFDI